MRKRAAFDVFGLSFLDVISCAFAAMLALVLLSRNSDVELIIEQGPITVDNSMPLDPVVERNGELTVELEDRLADLSEFSARSELLTVELESVQSMVSQLVANASVTPPPPTESGTMDSIYAGGVPVGAENIIFIIDTSGSMKAYWGDVVKTLNEILESHPKFSGLQILSDNGEYLIPGYAGLLIPDTNSARARASEKLKGWNALSNSSPAEGLERALKTYATGAESLSIYVFGDDFTGNSFDEVLAVIDRWNVDDKGLRKAAIHGIGFPWGIGNRYATLMREVAYRNKGVFVGL